MRAVAGYGLIVGLMLGVAGCGLEPEQTGADAAVNPANLQAGSWIGGAPVALTGKSDALRAVLFLDFDNKAAIEEAARLASLKNDHPKLIIVAATTSSDRAAAERFLRDTAFAGPIALGITPEVFAHYHVVQRPALRVVGKDGSVVGREVITLMAHLGRPNGLAETR